MPSADELRRRLEEADFKDVRVTRRALSVIFEGGPPQLLSTLATSGIAADLDALPTSEKERLGQTLTRNVAGATVDGGLHSEAVSHLAFARR
jgi:metal-dependent amidase/aminoacylase/carboxypeptidase family protein